VFGPAFRWRLSEEASAYHVRGWFQPYVDELPRMESDVEWLETEDYFEFRRRVGADDAEEAVRSWIRVRPEVADMNPVKTYLREVGR